MIGNCLSEEEKEMITEIIRDDFAYELGIVEKEEQRHKHTSASPVNSIKRVSMPGTAATVMLQRL